MHLSQLAVTLWPIPAHIGYISNVRARTELQEWLTARATLRGKYSLCYQRKGLGTHMNQVLDRLDNIKLSQ